MRTSQKKRRRSCDSDEETFDLTDKQLKDYTLASYLALVTRVTDRRALAPHEEEIARDNKRRIKNRESARESRERRNIAFELLVKENAALKDEIKRLLDEKQTPVVRLEDAWLSCPCSSSNSSPIEDYEFCGY